VIRRKYRWHEPEFDLALNTGLRQGNLYSLEFEMVDWENRMLHIPRTKNEEPLHVALNQTALEALLQVRRRGTTSGRVFLAKKTGKPLRGPRLGLTLRSGMLRLRTSTGTTYATRSRVGSGKRAPSWKILPRHSGTRA
jgi:integrase